MLYRNHQERANTDQSWSAGVWRHARQLSAIAVVGVMISMSLPLKVEAAAGDLDTTFSTDGRQTTDFAGGYDSASAIAIQADGKIVAAGYAYINNSQRNDFALARYHGN